MKWIPVNKRIPKVGEKVLCYYTIDKFEYFEIAKITEIHRVLDEEGRIVSIVWKDSDHNIICPTHWMSLPASPIHD